MHPIVEIFGYQIGSYGLVAVIASLLSGSIFLFSLKKRGILEDALNDIETFKNLLYASDFMSNVGVQTSLFD